MRIGIFTDTHSPDINGVATSISIVESSLKAVGHEVFIFAPNDKSRYEAYPEKNIWRLPSIKFYGEKRYRVAAPFLFRNDFKDIPIDLVHTQTPFSIGSIGLRFARWKELPSVHTYHTRYQEYRHYLRLPDPILDFVTDILMDKIIRFLNGHDSVIAPSIGIRKELELFGVRKPISVIPTGIDIAKTTSLANAKEPGLIFEELGLDRNDELVVLTSRLGKEKNVEFLLKAMKIVTDKRPQVCFLVIGDGTERENLKKTAGQMGFGNRIIFTGFMKHEKIFPLYRAAKVFVFASQTETQGLVSLEAMALGLPVVALKATGTEDLLNNDRGGFLIENNDPELFADAVIDLLEHPDLHARKSEEARKCAQDFSIEKTTKLLTDLYDEVKKSHLKRTGTS